MHVQILSRAPAIGFLVLVAMLATLQTQPSFAASIAREFPGQPVRPGPATKPTAPTPVRPGPATKPTAPTPVRPGPATGLKVNGGGNATDTPDRSPVPPVPPVAQPRPESPRIHSPHPPDAGRDPYRPPPVYRIAPPRNAQQALVESIQKDEKADGTQPAKASERQYAAQAKTALTSVAHAAFLDRCDAPAKELIALQKEISLRKPVYLTSSDVHAIEAYDRGCLSRPEQARPPIERALPWLQTRVGVLLDERGNVVCTATLVSPDHVLTARHCVFVKMGQSRRAWTYADPTGGPTRLSFLLDQPRTRPVKINAVVLSDYYRAAPLSFDEDDVVSDYVLLTLASRIEVPGAALRLSSPKKYEPVLLYGYFRYSVSVFPDPPPGWMWYADEEWKLRMRFDAQESCRIADIRTVVTTKKRGSCLIHACQTAMQASGAPIFRRPSSEDAPLVLVGVHTAGFEENRKGECEHDALASIPNVGVEIQGEIARRLPR